MRMGIINTARLRMLICRLCSIKKSCQLTDSFFLLIFFFLFLSTIAVPAAPIAAAVIIQTFMFLSPVSGEFDFFTGVTCTAFSADEAKFLLFLLSGVRSEEFLSSD